MSLLTKRDVFEKVPIIEPKPAQKRDILAVHTNRHLEYLENFGIGMIDADTYIGEKSYETALLAAGGVKLCVDEGRKYSFALVRPPGHHAGIEKAMGFCIFNNIAIGVKYALSKGMKKIFILDFDVHHGNGTQEIFQNTQNVVFLSLHQYPLYPGTGSIEETKENIINIPLPPGTCEQSYLSAIDEIAMPILSEFKPDMVFLSAGYDAHFLDPLGGMKLTSGCYYKIAERIVKSKVKAVFALEGGYNLDALAKSVYATLAPLFDLDLYIEDPISEEKKITEYAMHRIKAVNDKLSEFWSL
jgi:acetoin utilization deacetylase AcuC-like enzyme